MWRACFGWPCNRPRSLEYCVREHEDVAPDTLKGDAIEERSCLASGTSRKAASSQKPGPDTPANDGGREATLRESLILTATPACFTIISLSGRYALHQNNHSKRWMGERVRGASSSPRPQLAQSIAHRHPGIPSGPSPRLAHQLTRGPSRFGPSSQAGGQRSSLDLASPRLPRSDSKITLRPGAPDDTSFVGGGAAGGGGGGAPGGCPGGGEHEEGGGDGDADLLSLIFQLEPESLGRMMEELCGPGDVWKGVVRVPVRLSSPPPDESDPLPAISPSAAPSFFAGTAGVAPALLPPLPLGTPAGEERPGQASAPAASAAAVRGADMHGGGGGLGSSRPGGGGLGAEGQRPRPFGSYEVEAEAGSGVAQQQQQRGSQEEEEEEDGWGVVLESAMETVDAEAAAAAEEEEEGAEGGRQREEVNARNNGSGGGGRSRSAVLGADGESSGAWRATATSGAPRCETSSPQQRTRLTAFMLSVLEDEEEHEEAPLEQPRPTPKTPPPPTRAHSHSVRSHASTGVFGGVRRLEPSRSVNDNVSESETGRWNRRHTSSATHGAYSQPPSVQPSGRSSSVSVCRDTSTMRPTAVGGGGGGGGGSPYSTSRGFAGGGGGGPLSTSTLAIGFARLSVIAAGSSTSVSPTATATTPWASATATATATVVDEEAAGGLLDATEQHLLRSPTRLDSKSMQQQHTSSRLRRTASCCYGETAAAAPPQQPLHNKTAAAPGSNNNNSNNNSSNNNSNNNNSSRDHDATAGEMLTTGQGGAQGEAACPRPPAPHVRRISRRASSIEPHGLSSSSSAAAAAATHTGFGFQSASERYAAPTARVLTFAALLKTAPPAAQLLAGVASGSFTGAGGSPSAGGASASGPNSGQSSRAAPRPVNKQQQQQPSLLPTSGSMLPHPQQQQQQPQHLALSSSPDLLPGPTPVLELALRTPSASQPSQRRHGAVRGFLSTSHSALGGMVDTLDSMAGGCEAAAGGGGGGGGGGQEGEEAGEGAGRRRRRQAVETEVETLNTLDSLLLLSTEGLGPGAVSGPGTTYGSSPKFPESAASLQLGPQEWQPLDSSTSATCSGSTPTAAAATAAAAAAPPAQSLIHAATIAAVGAGTAATATAVGGPIAAAAAASAVSRSPTLGLTADVDRQQKLGGGGDTAPADAVAAAAAAAAVEEGDGVRDVPGSSCTQAGLDSVDLLACLRSKAGKEVGGEQGEGQQPQQERKQEQQQQEEEEGVWGGSKGKLDANEEEVREAMEDEACGGGGQKACNTANEVEEAAAAAAARAVVDASLQLARVLRLTPGASSAQEAARQQQQQQQQAASAALIRLREAIVARVSRGGECPQQQQQQQQQQQAAEAETEAEECWHEVWGTRTLDPVTGEDVLVLVQHDVTAKVIAERHLALVMETEHRLLEQLFPRHILQYITEDFVATAAAAAMAGGGGSDVAWRPAVRNCKALATWHPEVTLLFADIKGFTPMCKDVEPSAVMTMLNDLYSRYDGMLDTYGVFKVETIGDCYFVAGGLIDEDEDGMAAVRDGGRVDPLHAHKVFDFAKAMLEAARQVRLPTTGEPVEIRIGLHSGPVVSGVVGTRMPRFCLFGDTVNTTSRMESSGTPGAIHASEAAWQLLHNYADWSPTGGIDVKGKGLMQTYLHRPAPLALTALPLPLVPLPASSRDAPPSALVPPLPSSASAYATTFGSSVASEEPPPPPQPTTTPTELMPELPACCAPWKGSSEPHRRGQHSDANSSTTSCRIVSARTPCNSGILQGVVGIHAAGWGGCLDVPAAAAAVISLDAVARSVSLGVEAMSSSSNIAPEVAAAAAAGVAQRREAGPAPRAAVRQSFEGFPSGPRSGPEDRGGSLPPVMMPVGFLRTSAGAAAAAGGPTAPAAGP